MLRRPLSPAIYAWYQQQLGNKGIPVAFSKDYVYGIALVSPNLPLDVIRQMAGKWGYTIDAEVYTQDLYGGPPPYLDRILATPGDVALYLPTLQP